MSKPTALPEHEDLATAIAELSAMINDTRVMAEAGQSVDQIISQKEKEILTI